MSAMSPSLTSVFLSWRTTSCLNWSAVCRSVLAVRFTCKREPLVLPTAARKLFFVTASQTCEGLMFNAAIRSGFIQMRIANVRLLDAAERCKPRLDEPHEIICDLVRLKDVRSETQVRGSNLRTCVLNGD